MNNLGFSFFGSASVNTPIKNTNNEILTASSTANVLQPVSTSTIENTLETSVTSSVSAASSTLTVSSTAFALANTGPRLEFPSQNPIDGPDSDADGLTDAEEEVFGTDSGLFDTDADNYYDGQEIVNLYNPKGTVPNGLLESGLVKEFNQARSIYKLYYPTPWQIGTVDPAGATTLISAINGDYIEFTISPKKVTEDFAGWFGHGAPDERITELQSFTNRLGTTYKMRTDGLVAYVEKPDFVLVVIYHPSTKAPVAYRHIVQMMLNSLRIVADGTSR
jgi:hypothetical protein